MTKLLESNFLGADFARQSFRATPPAGVKFEEMLDESYWAHVARKVQPYDIIEIVPEDGAFYARLIVVNSAKLWLKVKTLEHITLTAKKKNEVSDRFEAVYKGPHAKWKVTNKSDGSVVTEESFQSRDEAETYIVSHVKELAA